MFHSLYSVVQFHRGCAGCCAVVRIREHVKELKRIRYKTEERRAVNELNGLGLRIRYKTRVSEERRATEEVLEEMFHYSLVRAALHTLVYDFTGFASGILLHEQSASGSAT